MHNHRCGASEEQPPGSLPHWRGHCIYSFLPAPYSPPPPPPSLPTCPLHCNCLFVSVSLHCQLYSSHTAASQHLLQSSALASTCSPCPLITPGPPSPTPSLFLTLSHLPFLYRLLSTLSVFNLLFVYYFSFSLETLTE